MCCHPRLFDPVQDPAREVEAEKPDEEMAKDRHRVPEIEFVCLDQPFKRGKMVFDQVPGLVAVVDLPGFCRERGDDQDPAGALQPLIQRLPVDLLLLQQPVEHLLLFRRQIDILVEVKHHPIHFPFSGVDQPLVVEEMVGEMDPGLVSGAVAALGENKCDLRLPQNLFIRFRDESPVEDEGCPGGIDLGEGPDKSGDIPDRARQSPDHHGKTGVGRAEERDVDLRQPDIIGVVAKFSKIHGLGVREDK